MARTDHGGGARGRTRGGFRVPVYAVLAAALVLGGVYFWWQERANRPPPPPTFTDADAGTSAIEDRLEMLRRAWAVSDLEALGHLSMPEPLDPDAEPEPPLLERRVDANGWRGELPALGEPVVARKDPHRYTVTWPLSGVPEPLVTFWEWDGTRWVVATWQVPNVRSGG